MISRPSRASRALDGGSTFSRKAASIFLKSVPVATTPGFRGLRARVRRLVAALDPRQAAEAEEQSRPRPLCSLHAELEEHPAAVGRAQRRLLAIGAQLDVARAGATEPVDCDLREAVARELDGQQVDRVGVAL